MTTRSRADLVAKIIEKLGVVPEGQPPEIEDTTRIDRNLPSLMSELAAREIIYIPDLDNIPDAWFLSLSKIAAYELRNEFGVTGEFEMTLKNQNEEAIGNIKTMLRGKPTYESLKTLSF